MRLRNFLAVGAAGLALTISSAGHAQDAPASDYDIAAQDLKYALRDLARQNGLELVAPSAALRGKRAPALRGRYSTHEALEILLRGADLSAQIADGAIVIRGRSEQAAAAPPPPPSATTDIVVTGSRIRGSTPASKLITISRDAMEDAGLTTLTDVIRTIPQNFGGGQNAGIGLNVPESRGVAAGSSSTLNLRGLGSDATLTLLNGQRLAYSVGSQSIDIATIPVIAIERLEVVVDGSSALYGSDAVGGVANVILRRDYQGLTTRARLGGATGGGYRQQQYSAIAGSRWASGGVMLAYEFGRDTAVLARHRDYAADRAPGLTLYPGIKRHNLIASGHQDLTETVSLEFDTLYNRRTSGTQYALDGRGDVFENGARTAYRNEALAIAPTLRLRLSSTWEAVLQGNYGRDRARYDVTLFAGQAAIFRQVGCYCNAAGSVEANANGTLLALPAGDVKVAIGGGWRTNDFRSVQSLPAPTLIDVSQDTYYAFGEIDVPVVAPAQDIPWLRRLNLTAAVRWEDHPGIDRVATPKFGIVLSPSAGLDLKATWGKSFKVPTTFQQYSTTYATLVTAARNGGTGYPADATAIELFGGNPHLRPERATTWTATLDLHPQFLPGASFELSYFHVNYRDRVVTPITFPSQSLSNPQYADLVNFAPSLDEIAAIANGDLLFQNGTGAPFDPANVVAIIDNRNRNAATQLVRGVDATARYVLDLPHDATLSFEASGSYIRLSQRLSALQPREQLAGTIFNIPHFRGRAGTVLKQGTLTASAYVNHIGSVRDVRYVPVTRVRSMTTIDIAASLAPMARHGLLSNVELSLSAQNLFNRHPGLIRSSEAYETPYDSTNNTPLGRVVSLSLTKRW